MKDTIFYDNLGISPYLSDEDLRREGKKLLLKWHPDKNENKEESSKRFIEVKEILDILCDPEKRSLYHQIGRDILGNNNNTNNKTNNNTNNFPDFSGFNDLFGNLTKIVNDMNINNITDITNTKTYDTDVTHIIKIDYQYLDPYISSVFHISYKRHKYEEKVGDCNLCNNTGMIKQVINQNNMFSISYKNCSHSYYREDYKKIIITISAEKIIDIIDKKQTIIMKGHGNILKNKTTDLIIIFED